MFTCSHTQAMNVVPSAKDTPQRPGYYMITNSTLQLHKTPGHNARAGSDQSKRGELRINVGSDPTPSARESATNRWKQPLTLRRRSPGKPRPSQRGVTMIAAPCFGLPVLPVMGRPYNLKAGWRKPRREWSSGDRSDHHGRQAGSCSGAWVL